MTISYIDIKLAQPLVELSSLDKKINETQLLNTPEKKPIYLCMKSILTYDYLEAVLLNHPAACVYIINKKIYLNRKAEEITGYTSADFASLEDWFHKVFRENESKVHAIYERAKILGFPQKDQVKMVTKAGQERIFDFQGALIRDVEIWHLADVTDQVLSQQRFSVLFNHSSDPHLLFDDTGIIDCNEATVKILNAESKADVMSRHPAEFSPELQPCGTRSEDKSKFMDAMAREHGIHRFEWVHKKLTGEEFPAEVTLSIVEVAGKKAVLVVWHDLTEMKQQHAALTSAAKMATLGELSANIAHEINNPLAIIAAKTSIIKRKLNNPEYLKDSALEDLDRIEKVTHRIAKVIRGLQSFSRETKPDQISDTNIKDCILDVLEIAAEKLKARGIDLKLEVDPKATVRANTVQLSQVFMNLISNASDAINDMSETWGTARPQKWIQISTEVHGDRIKILVKDCGSGIPKHVVENMMRPFFTTKDIGKGTGLGLSISKEIVETYGGQFYYDANQSNTCFVLEFPQLPSVQQAV